MTRVVDGIIVIAHEPESRCEDCGQLAECRPYGPNGTSICHPCGQKDPEGTLRRMFAYLLAREAVEGFRVEDDDR